MACLAFGGAIYFGYAGLLEQPLRQLAGAAYGLLPAGFGILGCALCGLAFIGQTEP
ncbi:MAG: hypothetical protein M1530_04445 [Candidatus Marsarchaeota archaeon]|nr:hypothetical protein [Candidatus Marsarchaeota archaeon]